jgi:hypothetical protein
MTGMQYRNIRRYVAVAAMAAAAACSKSNPAQPSGSAASSGSLTASIAAPRPTTPANNAAIRNSDQPVTVVALNAVSTKPGVTYTFEVATDAGFSTRIQTKDNIAEGTGGQTSVKLDALPAAKDYYWHVRASGGGTTGLFGATYKFTIGPAISLSAPVPVSPLTGAATSDRPTFTVADSVKAGNAGPLALTYIFEIADNAGFAPVAVTGNVAETAGQTSFAPPVSLPTGKTLYWRATAVDQADGISSLASTVQTFTATNRLWPGTVPPAGSGHATLGDGWDPATLTSFDGVRFDSPPLEAQRIFDLLDRGFDPQATLDWMNSNGYPTSSVYYASVQAFGFPYQYMALVNGRWSLVLRIGA